MEQIPLSEAIICINCNTISRRPKQYCPHCAGAHLVPIRKWLEPMPAPAAPDRSFVMRRHGWGSGDEAAKAVAP